MVDKLVSNFGCRLNNFESQQINHFLTKAGKTNLLVVNSCAVTSEAERKVKQKIRTLVRNNPDKEIAVVGCAAELHPEEYASMNGVSLVLGNAEKLKLSSYSSQLTTQVGEIQSVKNAYKELNIKHIHDQHLIKRRRIEVMIQNGCNHDCTFCAITQIRGVSRSVPIDQLVKYISKLSSMGINEVILTGVDISAYGLDLPISTTLGNLVVTLLEQVPDLPRLRLSSIDCIELDPILIEAITCKKRLMPHLHLSLQSGSNLILKRMKRRHSREQVIELCQFLHKKRPEIVFGADFIVGFPTETQEMFLQTLELVKECHLTYLHVFPFSLRHMTTAARIPVQVPVIERKKRAAILRRYGESQTYTFYQSLVGSIQSVLMETECFGRTTHFAPVHVKITNKQVGNIHQMYITSADRSGLYAILMNNNKN